MEGYSPAGAAAAAAAKDRAGALGIARRAARRAIAAMMSRARKERERRIRYCTVSKRGEKAAVCARDAQREMIDVKTECTHVYRSLKYNF